MATHPSRRLRRIARVGLSALTLLTLAVPATVGAQTGAAADTDSHVVVDGDTLSGIALDAGVDLATLASLNGINDVNAVLVGQVLKLPGATAPTSSQGSAAAPTPASTAYVIAAGDTLWSIAQQFGTTTEKLIALNGLDDPDRLVVGASLTVPGAATASPSPAAAPQPPAAAPLVGPKRAVMVSYTVRAGETLYGIGRQFGVHADEIAQASGLEDPSRIRTGTVLKIPQPGREHVVQAGETLRDIAATEKVDLGALIDLNAIDDPGLIRIGQVVLIPAPTTAVASSTAQLQQAAAPPAPAPSASPVATQPSAKPAKPVVKRIAPPPNAPTDGLAGAALKQLGAPYVWGGSSPKGFDCSGFIWYLSRAVGRPVSRGLLGQYNSGAHPSRDELKAGDLVFFQNTYIPGLSHNGVYIGNNLFVHAADETAGVTISSLTTAYWTAHWFGATRLP